MTNRGVRVARGLSASAIAVFAAAFSHVAAGGGAPGAVGLVLALALSAVVCVVLARRRLSLTALSVSVLISQFALHLLFEVGAGSGVTLSESGHHGHVTMSVATATDAVGGAAHPGHDSGWMWAGHAVAAVVTIAMLYRGERALRGLLALAVMLRERADVLLQRVLIGLEFAFARMLGLALASTSHGETVGAVRGLRRMAGSGVVDRLRDLVLVGGSLRHRGPPVAFAAHP